MFRLHVVPFAIGVCASAWLLAQEHTFPGIVRGVLLECDGAATTGQFSIRAQGSNEVYRFSFDPKTYMEREERRVAAGELRKGDTVEVVSDRDGSISVHYARTVHVIEARLTPRLPVSAGRYRMNRAHPAELPSASGFDVFAPRGDITFAGVVTRMTSDRVVLHTRLEGTKTVMLRLDTRYVENGGIVDASDLKPNTRVFVRAGKNLEDQIEAFQIIWGGTLEPAQPR